MSWLGLACHVTLHAMVILPSQGAGAAGYGKVVSHVVIGLKTVKGVKQLKLDPTIYDSLMKEKVQVGKRGRGSGERRRREMGGWGGRGGGGEGEGRVG